MTTWYGRIAAAVRHLLRGRRRQVRWRRDPQRAELAQHPQLGRHIGSAGGQGAVYTIIGRPGWVFKEYGRGFDHSLPEFQQLVVAGERVGDELAGVEFFWPIQVCSVGSRVTGYTMRRLPERYWAAQRTPMGTRQVMAHLGHAIPRRGRFRLVEQPGPTARLHLALLVGRGLQALHDHGVVYRDLSLTNIVFSLNPLSVGFLDLDSARPIVARYVPGKDDVDTPDWIDPYQEAPGSPSLGFDLDRYKYALLVYRLLAVPATSAPMTPTMVESIDDELPGLPPGCGATLRSLLLRSLGPRGSRVPVAEWLARLGPLAGPEAG